ncbi:MAG TPA: hypothetical protein VNY29_17845 [Terriglobales bacterium]|jgi:hypothetical protein|nr:hypothetical protein [Terriglobales bacterium]
MMTTDEILGPIFRAKLKDVHGLLLAANLTGAATGAGVSEQLRRAFEIVDVLLGLLEEQS